MPCQTMARLGEPSSYKPEAQASESLTSNTLACDSGLYKGQFTEKWRSPPWFLGRLRLGRDRAYNPLRYGKEEAENEIGVQVVWRQEKA
jgi:hypothetical protein